MRVRAGTPAVQTTLGVQMAVGVQMMPAVKTTSTFCMGTVRMRREERALRRGSRSRQANEERDRAQCEAPEGDVEPPALGDNTET